MKNQKTKNYFESLTMEEKANHIETIIDCMKFVYGETDEVKVKSEKLFELVKKLNNGINVSYEEYHQE